MNDETKVQALQASRLATDLGPDECRVLSALCGLHELADGDVLVREGASDSRLHVVARGVLGVVKDAAGDERVTIATLGVGDLAGELGFVDGTKRHASLVALGGSQVLSLEREKLESLLDTHPAIVYHVMRAIVRTVHQIQRRLSMQSQELQNYISKQHGRY